MDNFIVGCNRLKKIMRRIFHLLLIGLIPEVTALAAAGQPAGEAKPKIERIALFKNGLGYATAVGTLPDKAATVKIGQLPVPSYGTFWVGYPKDVKLRRLVTAMETTDEIGAPSGVDELLRLNPGRQVVVRTSSGPTGEQAVIAGTVQSSPIAPLTEPPNPYFMDFRRSPERPYYPGYPQPPQPAAILLASGSDIIALNPGSILRADFQGGGPLNMP